jgi:hypothetical protein
VPDRFAVLVRSKEGVRLVDDTAGCRWEQRWLTSTWTIEDSWEAANKEAASLNVGKPPQAVDRAFVVPEPDRFLYVGLS